MNHSNSSNRSGDSVQDLDRATDVINMFLPWLIIFFGIVFNLLTVLVMRTRNFRSLSTSVFMMVGAVNDLTSIPILLFPHWLHLNFPETITRARGADFLCKFFSFYGWGQADFGMMLLSAMTADRAYAILRPMTTVDLVKRAKIVTGVCGVVVVAKEFHFWFSAAIVSLERKDRLCDVTYTSAPYDAFYNHYWPWIDTVFVTGCFVVMVISNSVLAYHVRKNRKGGELKMSRDDTPGLTRTSSTMSIHAGASYNSVSSQVTKMLLGESLALFLLSYPFSIHLMVTSQIDDLHDDPAKDKANALAFNIVFYLLYTNKCVNFIVYILAGKKFRSAVREDVLCRFRVGNTQFGRRRAGSESGEGSLQRRSQHSANGRTRPKPPWRNVPPISCVSGTTTET